MVARVTSPVESVKVIRSRSPNAVLSEASTGPVASPSSPRMGRRSRGPRASAAMESLKVPLWVITPCATLSGLSRFSTRTLSPTETFSTRKKESLGIAYIIQTKGQFQRTSLDGVLTAVGFLIFPRIKVPTMGRITASGTPA